MFRFKLGKFSKSQALVMLFLAVMTSALVAFAITSASTSFVPQAQPTGYVGQNEVSNYNLTSGNETIYRDDYDQEFWSGNLHANPVDANGVVDYGTEVWVGGAQAQLATQSFTTRLIATRSDAAPSAGIPFQYSSLTTTQQALFPALTINLTPYTGSQIVDFLRGDRSNESGSGMRLRSAGAVSSASGPVLGDIIHSRPYYVADANNPRIFVGANDGMLHAFDVATGAESWAYVPSMLLSKMKNLAFPYGGSSNPHDYFVDGQININTLSNNNRILVGGLGAGGKGLYALNITGSAGLAAATEANVASKAIWEINGTTGTVNNVVPTPANAYYNLGFTYGTPLIGRVNTATNSDAVIAGNGYNDNILGDYQARLYVINAIDGTLIASIPAGSSGTSTSPNGIFNTVAVDTNNDGKVDRVYAGDLKGTLWKFDLSSTSTAAWSATAIYTTSPAQPITSTPGVALHPNGGYMITFGTGSMLDTADTTDVSVHYVYGIWDGPYTNTAIITQTLQERTYTFAGTTTRVRRVTDNQPSWTSGGTLGWQVALPAGELVTGEGSFIESGRYYFTSHNPNISTLVGATTVTSIAVSTGGTGYTTASVSMSGCGGSGATATASIVSGAISALTITNSGTGYTCAPTVTITGTGSGATAVAATSPGTTVWGENWLMELNYLNGGSSSKPFLDLNHDLLLNNSDRISYIASDIIPAPAVIGDPVTTPNQDGIPVGKWISIGVQSQPILVQLATLNTTMFNINSDVVFPVTNLTYGVTGGHFDVDIYYGSQQPTATITLGTTGQTNGFPATLGGIQVGGVTIVPPLTVTDITNGFASTTNAALIQTKVYGGFTATVVGNVITVKAPASYNGQTMTVLNGTSQTLVPATAGSPGLKATATITVGSTGNTYPATLGGIKVNGTTTIVPALTITDITNGSSTNTNATTIKNKINALTGTTGYTATCAGGATCTSNVITVTAPAVGTTYNGQTLIVSNGSVGPNAPLVYPTGLITFAGTQTSTTSAATIPPYWTCPLPPVYSVLVYNGTCIGGSTSTITIGTSKSPIQTATAVAMAIGTGGTIKAYAGGNAITPTCASASTSAVCIVDTSTYTNGNSIYIGAITNPGSITSTPNTTSPLTTTTVGGVAAGTPSWNNLAPNITVTPFAGGANSVAASPQSGWTNLAPALAVSAAFSGGHIGYTCNNGGSKCTYNDHTHQYDKVYNKTGVSMLNASKVQDNLIKAITSPTTSYKVIAHNQYLSPAVEVNIGNATYNPILDVGYVKIKNFVTSATLDLATLPTYTGNTEATGNIHSLVFNMPVDALTAKDWWGNGDVRAGLLPTTPSCVYEGASATQDGNMYQPVIPPVNGVDGPGAKGWSSATTQNTATGARHGGALTFQIIDSSTPNSAIEQNVPGRPEYGWRVTAAHYQDYVWAEYNVYWHHPNGKCYFTSGWTKSPPQDNGTSTLGTPAAGNTDPKIGDLSGAGGGIVTSVVITYPQANVTFTTITYSTGKTATIQRTSNSDGSVAVVVRNADCVSAGASCGGVTDIILPPGSTGGTGGDERGTIARTGRISWHELIRN